MVIYECPYCHKHFLDPPSQHDCYIIEKRGDRLVKIRLSNGRNIPWIKIEDGK